MHIFCGDFVFCGNPPVSETCAVVRCAGQSLWDGSCDCFKMAQFILFFYILNMYLLIIICLNDSINLNYFICVIVDAFTKELTYAHFEA